MRDQDYSIQLWAESDSIGSVIAPVAERYTIPTFIGRGYSSRGYLWSAARDAVEAHDAGKIIIVFHVGDFDPSGEDIFRDLEQTFRLYAAAIQSGRSVAHMRRATDGIRHLVGPSHFLADVATDTEWIEFERLALTQEQVDEHHLPSRPPKASDTRTAKFIGRVAVEVEALPIDALLAVVEQAIIDCIDPAALRVAEAAEASERDIARRIAGTPVDRLLEAAS
jgi:hypothetical protein